jgi:hypothetical protein
MDNGGAVSLSYGSRSPTSHAACLIRSRSGVVSIQLAPTRGGNEAPHKSNIVYIHTESMNILIKEHEIQCD